MKLGDHFLSNVYKHMINYSSLLRISCDLLLDANNYLRYVIYNPLATSILWLWLKHPLLKPLICVKIHLPCKVSFWMLSVSYSQPTLMVGCRILEAWVSLPSPQLVQMQLLFITHQIQKHVRSLMLIAFTYSILGHRFVDNLKFSVVILIQVFLKIHFLPTGRPLLTNFPLF